MPVPDEIREIQIYVIIMTQCSHVVVKFESEKRLGVAQVLANSSSKTYSVHLFIHSTCYQRVNFCKVKPKCK